MNALSKVTGICGRAVARTQPLTVSAATRRVPRSLPGAGTTGRSSTVIVSRPQQRGFASSSSNSNNTTNNVRPYSGSLPCPGYEWCSKCNIPSKQLQKEIGAPNACLELNGAVMCSQAKQYYINQCQAMLLLMGFCFGLGPLLAPPSRPSATEEQPANDATVTLSNHQHDSNKELTFIDL
mmetsp:Transcript_4332/g.9318  ORF Transcript_4332/g.9318 Transcript_4332/m.9318 type:complete len:180 (+) Transcript_4332:302-841(+)